MFFVRFANDIITGHAQELSEVINSQLFLYRCIQQLIWLLLPLNLNELKSFSHGRPKSSLIKSPINNHQMIDIFDCDGRENEAVQIGGRWPMPRAAGRAPMSIVGRRTTKARRALPKSVLETLPGQRTHRSTSLRLDRTHCRRQRPRSFAHLTDV